MNRARVRILVRGAVQGVGFRPFVHRLARKLSLGGWVRNDGRGVVIEAEGSRFALQELVAGLEVEKPPLAVIQSVETLFIEPAGRVEEFLIRESEGHGDKAALILPDTATCPDCLRELFDPRNRRFRHPFINCTNCGPRFSIIESLPYDRPNTSMKKFAMCADCEREYRNPLDRRFHAQPTACPFCGPRLSAWEGAGHCVARGYEAVEWAARELRLGRILAFKGIGGFQLMVDAGNEEAVCRLRARKHREEKPFAVMAPSLEAARRWCELEAMEERLLESPQAPIVLLRRRGGAAEGEIAGAVAPRNPYLGVMLPYSPLHHLLLRELGFPVVATSGNLTDEPICIDEWEAVTRLGGIADLFLVHDRPVVRYLDDSVVRVLLGREQVLRRARGYAPLPVHLKEPLPLRVLALGGHLKNTVALGCGTEVYLSQHLGDLETEQANEAFRRMAGDLPRLYEAPPEVVACDLHPEYHSTVFAGRLQERTVAVQHHRAHVLSCMAEHGLEPPVLGVSWDGTGLGEDGTIWGGEFLLEDAGAAPRRMGHLHGFRLPGGEAAIREPRRTALGVLWEVWGEEAQEMAVGLGLWKAGDAELALLRRMMEREVQSPLTTSAGRLFDAVAAIMGMRSRVSYEGQAAVELEFAIEAGVEESYPFGWRETAPLVADWRPAVRALVEEVRGGERTGAMAARFHNTLAGMVCAAAERADRETVVLTGGCFQNRYLTERCVAGLRQAGFRPYWHQRVPPNDGGISLGQVLAAVRGVEAAAAPAGMLAGTV